MRGLPAGLERIQPMDQNPYTRAAIAQTSANTSAYDISSPRSGERPSFIRTPDARAPAGPFGSAPDIDAADRGTSKNSLFCQRPVQKVEPILSPEQLVAIDVGRRAEHLPLDGF